MSSWAKALQSMSNAVCADPGLEEPVRQEGGGSRAPWQCGAVAGKCGRGMCHGRRGMAQVTSPLQLRRGFCCELTVMGNMGNINWINVH